MFINRSLCVPVPVLDDNIDELIKNYEIVIYYEKRTEILLLPSDDITEDVRRARRAELASIAVLSQRVQQTISSQEEQLRVRGLALPSPSRN